MFCKKHKTEDAGQSKYTEEDIDSKDNDGHDKRDQARLMPERLQQPSSLVETPKHRAASSALASMIFKPGPAEEVHVPYFSLDIRMKGVRRGI